MHIEINIFPDSFSIDPRAFSKQMGETMERVRDHVQDACINKNAAALGNTTMLDLEDKGYIVATIAISNE